MGGVVRRLARVVTGAVSGFMGGGPIGAIVGGVGSLFGKGGMSALQGPMNMFSKLAGSVLGKLGQAGLGALKQLPMRPGLAPMPYPCPRPPMGGIGAPSGGPALTSSESKLIGRFGKLEGQMNALMDKLNAGDKLSQAELAQIQTQMTKISNMMKQITSILNQLQDTMKNIIQNIRA